MPVLGRSYVLPLIIRPRQASGSSSFPTSLSDTVPLSDTLTTNVSLPRGLADSVSISDALSRVVVLPRSLADTVPLSDAVAGNASKPRSLADSVPVSDSLVRSGQALPRALADSVPISDSLSGTPVLTRPSHLVVFSGAVAHAQLLYSQPFPVFLLYTPVDTASNPTSLADTFPISDSLSRGAQTLTRSVADSVPLSDSVSGNVTEPRSLADSVPISDSVAGVASTFVQQRVTIYRTITPVPQPTQFRLFRPLTAPASTPSNLSDTVPISDALSRLVSLPRSLADTVPISDSLASGASQARSLADTVPISDVLTESGAARPRSITDTVPISDSTGRVDSLSRGLADSVPLSDAISRSGGTRPRGLADTVPLSDSISTGSGSSRTLADTVPVGDSLTRSGGIRPRTLADSVVVSDALSRVSGTRPRQLADSVPISDSLHSQFDLVHVLRIRPLPFGAWKIRPINDKSRARPIGGTMNRSVLSLDYVRYAVQADTSPTGDTVQFAFIDVYASPTPSDWVTGSWETAALPTGEWVARCLVGPGGAFVPGRDTYSVWIKITDSPTVPVWNVGTRSFS